MLSSLISSRVRVRFLLTVLVLYGVAALAMFVWPGFVSKVGEYCGQTPLDVRGYWTTADARELVAACGDAGRTAYRHLQLLDLIYPALAGAALLMLTALLLRRYGGRAWPLLVPVLVMTVLDYAENVTVWTILLRWPDVNATVAAIGGAVTAVKRIAGFVAFTIPLVLALAEIIQRGRARRSRPA